MALLTAAAEVAIGAEGPAIGAVGGTPVIRLEAGRSVTIRPEGAALTLGDASPGRFERVSFASTAPERSVTVAGRPYRGVVDVYPRGGALAVVNVLPVEQYVQGVVNAEMGRRAAEERAALEAQAVVSRTYALRNRGRYAAEGYDLLAGVSDQVYGGLAAETELGREAVRRTAGLVLRHDHDLITPFFHSTCGGSTASPEEAFVSVRGTPYLRPVSDAHAGGHFCDISPRFRWRVEWEGDRLRGILGRTLPAQLGVDSAAVTRVHDVYVRRTGPSGRVTDLRVRVEAGEVPVPGYAVRAVLEAPDGRVLGSTAVRLEPERAGDTVVRLVAEGRGWGHGVGLCQWGAVGRARAGQDVQRILSTYFPGSTLARWY